MGRIKLLPLILLVLLVLPLVISTPAPDQPSFALGYHIDYELIDTHKVNKTVIVNSHVYNISTGQRLIAPVVSCTLDLYDLEGNQLVSDYKMTYLVGLEEFRATVDAGNFTRLGEMSQSVYCNSSGFGGFESNGFIVTQTGEQIQTPESIIYLIFFLSSWALFCLVLYGSIKIPYRNPPNPDGQVIGIHEYGYLKVLCIVFNYVILMWIMGIIRSVMFNYEFINGSYKLFNWVFWVMFSFMWPLIVVSFLLILLNYISTKKFQKALERGVPIR